MDKSKRNCGIKWKDIAGYESLYQVSELGDVFSFKTGRILKPRLTGKYRNYHTVVLYTNGMNKNFTVHRLVASAFIPNIENKPQVNHIDGNPTNNNVSNLEWATNSENQKHAFKLGLQKPTMHRLGVKGSENPNSKEVHQFSFKGEFLKTYSSVTEASQDNNVNTSGIILTCQNKREHAGGYKWSYDRENIPTFKSKRKGRVILNRKIKNPNKYIFDTILGIFYISLEEVSRVYGISRSSLSAQLRGQNKNKTNLIYV